jgi:ribosomal protection tetracycline resistance protein
VAQKQLNLGILAHVDAGKTTLTERLLYEAGVIDAVGSVDAGTTQTDSLPLERQRGITIKAAVASFNVGDVHVNLIDTPGHPDFIAEVDRALAVLDGAVLVVSAVEGVQPQTRILMRALQRLHVPTVVFVNKTDRTGADVARVTEEMRRKLSPSVGEAYPVLAGSARTGAGVRELMQAITERLPAAAGDADGPVDGTVFKIERGPTGEKVAYLRMRSGTLRTRDRIRLGKVTALAVFEQGGAVQRRSVSAGAVAKVWGLGDARVGDRLAEADGHPPELQFAPPTLESVLVAGDPEDRARLRVALAQLAEQDPLIRVRQDDTRGEISVSLYGEVQKEVVEATLAADYGIAVSFRDVTPIYVERPTRRGEAIEVLHAETNPFLATIGLRIEPAPPDAGIEFRLAVHHGSVPLYSYKTMDRFADAMRHYVLEALQEGLLGWQVVDCVVTMTDSVYSVPDGPPSRRGPLSTPADFRKLTPIVLRRALERAGTTVCEPMMRLGIEAPASAVGAVLAAVGQLGGEVEPPAVRGDLATVDALLPAVRAHDLQRRLSNVAHGEATVESTFGGYRPVGDASRRRDLEPRRG